MTSLTNVSVALAFVVGPKSMVPLPNSCVAEPISVSPRSTDSVFPSATLIVPTVLFELITDKDAAKVERVMQAIMQMKKLDIRALKQAAEGQV